MTGYIEAYYPHGDRVLLVSAASEDLPKLGAEVPYTNPLFPANTRWQVSARSTRGPFNIIELTQKKLA